MSARSKRPRAADRSRCPDCREAAFLFRWPLSGAWDSHCLNWVCARFSRLPMSEMPKLSRKLSCRLLGHQVDLVAQVDKRGIDRRSRQHEDLGLDALANHLIEQPLITFALMVAEVVGLINDDQIEVLPVEVGEIDVASVTAVARKVGVRKQRVCKAIISKWIACMPGMRLVERPVRREVCGDRAPGHARCATRNA